VVHILDHSYAHILRATRDTPSVVTVHDLIPQITVQRKPHNLRERIRNALLARVLDSLRKADAWIVATEWLKTELAEWLDEDERIHVIPYGVDEAFFAPPVDGREVVRQWWKIPEDAFVVLHVGSVDKRKNFGAVIGALDGLRSEGVEAWLLQVGGTLSPEHVADIKARNLDGAVTALGAANEADLRAAYRASDVLLFPSLYEGFGFPVLEAMASELPVVTSGAGGLAEVAGEAALVVGGREVEPYTAVLKGIAESEEARGTLARRGLEQARRFRWAEAARRTADVYRALV
jgi:glycosyltransferase involved in cell wall biosynthesis